MTRTLVLTNDLPPRSGGIETFVHELLVRQPRDSVVVLGPANESAASFDAVAPYEVVRHRGAVLPTGAVLRHALDVARGTGCDQVLIPSAFPVGLLAPRLARAGLPVAVTMTHGNEAGWARVPGMRATVRAIGESSFVTYLGEYTRSRIAPVLPREARMRRLAPAVDAARFHPAVDGTAVRRRLGLGDRPVVGCISRLVARKGQDRLIEVLPRLRERVPGAAVLIAGTGPDEARLRRLAARMGVVDHVVMAGRVPDEELPEYYAACDVFALPCRTRNLGIDVEGLGIVLLEASATGRPVVAGDSGGAPDAVLQGRTGLVVPDDRAAIVDSLARLLRDRDAAQAMGRAGREWVLQSWTWETPAGRLRSMMRGIDPDA